MTFRIYGLKPVNSLPGAAHTLSLIRWFSCSTAIASQTVQCAEMSPHGELYIVRKVRSSRYVDCGLMLYPREMRSTPTTQQT